MDMCNCLKKSKSQLRKVLAGLIVFTGVVMGAQAVDYYWVGGASGDWSTGTNWNTLPSPDIDNPGTNPGTGGPGASDKAIISADTEITVDIAVNVGNVEIATDKKLILNAAANFTPAALTNDGNLYFYNISGTSRTFSTPEDANLGNFYFWGNVEIVINGDCSAAIFSMQADSADHYCSDDFTATLSKGSGTGKLTASGEINLTRASDTSGKKGTLIVATDLTTTDTLWTHSGVIFQINDGITVAANNYTHSAPTPDVLAQTIIKGTFNVTNTFEMSYSAGSTEIQIDSTGHLNTVNLTGHAETYTNPGSTTPFTNSGTITTTTLDIPYNVVNTGTINTSGTSPSLSAASFSGAGTINLNGGGDSTSLTATSTSTTSAQYAIVLNDTNATISGNYSLTSFSATDANSMSGKTVTLNNATITASSIYLSGTNGSPLALTGTGTTHTFTPTNLTLSWLSIDDKISLGSYTADISGNNCVPALDPTVEANWYPLLRNGWNLMAITSLDYSWTGTVDTDWNKPGNWNTGFVPGTNCKITIPSTTNKPVIPSGDSDFAGGTLTIASGASLQLGSKNLVLSGTVNDTAATILTNNGKIIFTDSGRIKDSTTEINDTAQGTVEYSASGSGTITDFSASGDDYNNLVIKGTGWTISSTGTIKIKDTISIPAEATCNISNTTTIQANTFDFNGTATKESFSVAGSKNVTLMPYDTTSDFEAPLSMYTFSFEEPRGWVYLDAGSQDIVFNTAINGDSNYIPYKMRFKSDVKLNADIQVRDSVYAEKNISESGALIFAGTENIEFTGATPPYIYNKIKSTGASGTLTINGPCTINELTIDGRETTINGDNTITTFKAENKKSKITFEAGTTQTVTSISLSGIDADNLLTLTSTGTWSINCSNTPTALEYLSVKNSNNTSSGIFFAADNSKDNGGNVNWIFPNMEYVWTGTAAAPKDNTSWDEPDNWESNSVPTPGSTINIKPTTNDAYPILAANTILHTTIGTNDYDSTITVSENASLTLAGYDLEAGSTGSITNNGKVLLKGNETITGTIDNGTGTVEYYDNTVTVTSFNWKNGEFKNLIISKPVSISDPVTVTVTGTTEILAVSGTVSLDNSGNVFGGTVTVGTSTTNAGTVTLNGSGTSGAAITLSDDVYATALTLKSDVQATDLTVYAPLTINGAKITANTVKFTENVDGTSFTINGAATVDISGGSGTISTTGTQTYNRTVTRNYATTFAANDGTANQTITFKGDVTGSNALTVNADITIGTTGIKLAGTQIDFNGNIDSTGKNFYINTTTFNSTKTSAASITANTIELLHNVTFDSTNGISLAVTKITGSDYKLTNVRTLTLGTGITVETAIENSGTLTCSGNATFANDVDLSVGTFSHSTGIVYLTAGTKNPATLSGSSTFANLTINAPGKTIKFADSSEQTVSGYLNLSGSTGTGNLLKLIPAGTGTWKINCALPQTLSYLFVENSNNTTAGDVIFTATNSTDNGGNSNWAFPGQEYEWQGTVDTSWDTAGNWSPSSVPGKGAIISIPANGAPELASDVNIAHTTETFGTITIAATGSLNLNGHTFTANKITNSGELDLDGKDLTVTSITNNGKVLLKGNETIAGTINNGTGTVEYYDNTVSVSTFNWKNGVFNNLIISKPVSISDPVTVTVNGTTEIVAGSGIVSLDNSSNVFGGAVTVGTSTTNAGTVTLNGSGTSGAAITLSDDVYATALTLNSNVKATDLTVYAPITINAAQITTTGTQTYNGTMTFGATGGATTLSAKTDTVYKKITIKNSVNGSYTPVFDSDVEANLSGGSSVNTSLAIKGNFENTGTWASAAGKKLIINGAGDQSFTAGTGTYETIELSKGSGKTITFADTPTITNLTEASNAGNITFSAGANITNGAALTTTGTVTVSGDIATTNADFSATTLVAGATATISTGTGTQSYGTINGTAGTETLELTAASVTFNGNIGSPTKLGSLTVNGASVINGASIKANTVTLKGGNVTGTATEIDGNLVLGTSAAGIIVSIPLTAKGNITFNGNNTIDSLTATGLGNKTFTFEAGKTQTVNGKLILSGTADSDGNRLTLKSSAEGNTWTINCTRTSNDHDIQYAAVQDSVNTSTYNLFAFHSQDLGNNTKWNFPDMTYIWTGAVSDSWTQKNNWNPQIVPSKGGNILIPDVSAGSGRYPLLAANLELLDTYNSVKYGTITVKENAEFDIAGFNLTVKSITNNGRLRLKGNSGQSITGTMSNGVATPPSTDLPESIVEYYGGTTTDFIWDGNNDSTDGKQYKNLEITNAATFHEKIVVTGTTKITAGAGNAVTLDSSSNSFSGVITAGSSSAPASNAGAVTLKAADSVTIANNANATSLDITCPIIKLTKVTTSATQTYTGAVSGPAATTNIDLQNTGLCTINGSLSASSLNMAGDASITGSVTTTATQTYNGNVSGGTAGGTVSFNGTNVTFKKSLTTTGTAAITANVFLDNATTADFGDSAGSTTAINITGNLIIHNGTITANTNVSVSLDTIILGTNYSLEDSSTGFTNEYAYKPTGWTRSTDWSQPNYTAALPATHTAKLKVVGGKTISVGKNFYANGTELSKASGTAKWILEIPDITNPGNGFAEAYKSDISDCNVICSDGTTNGTKAKLVTLDCTDNGSTTNTSNTNVDFDDFKIVDTWTTRDNVVYVKFNRPVRNINGELNAAIANFKYYNGTSDTAYDSIATQADGTSPLAEGSEPDTIYLVAPSTWNTDAGWAGSATGISAGNANSTDRNGTHKSAKPYIDIPRALGSGTTASQGFVITDQFGKRLKHYGNTARITEVLDKCGPVLVAVRTGQETHETTLASQQSYDAHNFIEFIYSEAVNFGSASGTYLQASSVPEQNIQVADDLGIVTSTLSAQTNLTFAGIGVTIANGKMHTKRAGTGNDDATVNAMYRDSTHSLKISLAGYASNVSTSGTITGTYVTWPGYIESARLPSGAVTTTATPAVPNALVTDCAVALNGTTPLYNQQIMQKTSLTVNNSEQTNTNYGKWDTQEPVFVKVHRHGDEDAQDYYEAVGNGDGSNLNRIEIHISDNPSEVELSESFNRYWLTGFGWADSYNSASPKSPAADDLIGGARPYVTGTVNASHTTSGGIRYCTMLNQEGAFKYEVGSSGTPVRNFTSIEESASAPFFVGASSTRNNIPTTKDNTYISLALSDTNLPYKTIFTFSYDDTSSYITDLAGNRLRSVPMMNALDRTSPDFKISFAPVNQDKLYLIFVKKLTTGIKYNGNEIAESFETIIPQCIQLGKITGSSFAANTGTDIQVDTSVPASIIGSKSNDHYTAIQLTLNRNITMEDIEQTYVRIVSAPGYSVTSRDPITGLEGSYVTFIQDYAGNYMPMYQAHTLSDFAANMVSPLYAYNDDLEYNEENLTFSLYESGTWAVHDWDKEQTNYGTLLAEKPVTIISNVDTSYFTVDAGTGQPDFTLRLYYSKAPTPGSESNEYNDDLHDTLRLWAPDNPNFADNGLFPAYAAVTNQNFSYVDSLPVDDSATVDLSKGIQFKFDETIAQTFTGGSQISFLFGLFDSTGTTQKSICLNPILSMNSGNPSYNTSAHVPLYLIRLKNPSDITSMDLWSFKVRNIAGQRGGVSILNNVINPMNGEKTVLKVDMPSDGKLNILVMTLDGNVIQYLNRGRTSAGEHYFTWDGKNLSGVPVARGMYFIRVTGSNFDETRKVLVVK